MKSIQYLDIDGAERVRGIRAYVVNQENNALHCWNVLRDVRNAAERITKDHATLVGDVSNSVSLLV
jgi:hypothetical protein